MIVWMNIFFHAELITKVFICSADTDLGAACVAEYLKQGSKINATCLSAKKLKRLLKRFDADENDKNLNILINDISSEKQQKN